MKIAIDTNVFVYGEGINGAERAAQASEIVARLPIDDIVVPVQVLGELFRVLQRKGGFSTDRAGSAVSNLAESFELAPTTPEVLAQAIDLATLHAINIWDAVILCAAMVAGCRLLLSEDMQDGFTFGGVTVVDPFSATRHPLLTAALRG